MTEEFTGNVLVAQSGGPTSVINASLAGVIQEALNQECIGEIYGGLNGIQGILEETLIDLASEQQHVIKALRFTPGSALGTCRYKLKSQKDLNRVLDVFEAHDIRFFFYIGGNDSQDTTAQISKCAQERGYDLRAIGIPKTIDNDLAMTDHCPGYGSVIKYIATTVREMALDHESMGQHDLVSIVEVMGRTTGWIAAGSALAKYRNAPEEAPHLIYVPEVPFSKDAFLSSVKQVLATNKYCLIVASEGLVDADGNYIATENGTKDAFGHALLGGVASYLQNLVESELGVKARSTKLGINQRAAAHAASLTDNKEAFECGKAAVNAAVDGSTDKMVTLVRGDSQEYTCQTELVNLSDVANSVKQLPTNWIADDRTSVTNHFLRYATPLIQGEVDVEYANGLPKFRQLQKQVIDKKLEPYVLAVHA